MLVGFYEQKSITLANSSKENATVVIEADPDGSGTWMTYQTITVNAGKRIKHVFDNGFQARWIRLRSVTDATLTANIECTFRQPKDEEALPDNPSLIGRGVMIATSGKDNNNLPGGGR